MLTLSAIHSVHFSARLAGYGRLNVTKRAMDRRSHKIASAASYAAWLLQLLTIYGTTLTRWMVIMAWQA
jgi:hypothetical protein